ncbi:MAG: hypothetical protein HC923_06570, partial [Myxococcales bacterium]|nr:hypothetical protein [Myxococcales bacterium]
MYLLSEDDLIRANDQQIFTSGEIDLVVNETVTLTDTVTLPTFTSTVNRFVGVALDFFSEAAKGELIPSDRGKQVVGKFSGGSGSD